MSKNNKVTITIDMDALREHIRKEAKKYDGLEDSSGMTPYDLDLAWDSTKMCLGDEGESLREVFDKIVTLMTDAHEQFKKDEEDDTDEE